MSDSDTLHEVHSLDEAISVGAEELGVDEDELRERIENLELVRNPDSVDSTQNQRSQTD